MIRRPPRSTRTTPSVPTLRASDLVSGSEAQHLVRRCIQAVDAEKKVMIGFRLGDLWTDTFTYSKGKRAGEQGVSLKARLLFVSWIKVDGKLVYKAEPKRSEEHTSELQSLMRISYAVFCLKKKNTPTQPTTQQC